jgi:HlyD family secretion protein
MSMFRKLWFWVALGLVAAAVVFAFARTGRKEKENGAALKTAKVARGNLLASITATGLARPIQTVELKCKASGEIKFLPIDDGRYVKKGDLICKLDQTTAKNDYEQAKADYDVAVASEKQQKKEFDRILELYEKKLVSESERDNVELNFQRAHSQTVRAEAALSTSAERLADTELKAPIDGIILRRDVEVGQVISSGVSSVSGGTTIALLADLNHVNVLADVDETDIGRVKIGQNVKAVADAFPDQEFSGRVLKIAPLAKVAQNVTTFEVTAEVDNPGHLLKSGMNANVEIMTAERRNVLMVPNEAVKELSEVIPYFSEEERKKFEGLAMGAGGGNRQGVSFGGGAPTGGGGQMIVVQQGGPGGGGGGRSSGGRPGGGRQFRQNMDMSQIDTTKLDPEARERIKNWQKRQAERKSRGDTIGIVEVPKWVLIKEKDKIIPKRIIAGVSNLDNTEVVSGLNEGDEVIAQPTSMLAREREEMQQRMRSFGGIPGMSSGSGGGRR